MSQAGGKQVRAHLNRFDESTGFLLTHFGPKSGPQTIQHWPKRNDTRRARRRQKWLKNRIKQDLTVLDATVVPGVPARGGFVLSDRPLAV